MARSGLLLAVCIILVACTSTAATPTPNYADLEITLERTRCYGICPAYKLVITGDGTVTYEGFYSVLVTGKQQSSIDRASLDKLVELFRSADYFALQDSYVVLVTDLPTVTTSLRLDGRTKRISNYGRCRKEWEGAAPEKLCALEQSIDQIVDSKRWVGR